jgi:hypothetical protein
VPAPSESTSLPRQPLSWLRFSLRTLLLVITAIAVIGGWPISRAVRQRDAIRHFRELTSRLPPEHFYDHYLTISFASSRSLDKLGRPPHPIPAWRSRLYSWLGGHECWDTVDGVVLSNARVANDDLRFLAALPGVEDIRLAATDIDDEGIPLLHHCPKLRILELEETSISDKGLAQVVPLRRLEALLLGRTAITDEGLRHLAALENLESLTLRGTAITDRGVPHLARLKRLTELFLNDTAVTEQGYRSLRAELPNCKIRGAPAPER